MRTHHVVAVLLIVSLAAFAQSDRGTITGTVSDPASAIIPGAKVSAKNVETGAAYETVTTGTGNYTLPSLPVGSYDLTIEASGFGKYLQQGITIQTVQTARIDVVLKVGSTTESVTVNADAPLLKTESAEQSKSITGDKINQMPMALNGGVRNPIVGIMLAPGVYSPNPGSFTMRVNGGVNNTYKVLMDGQDVTMSGSDPTHLSESQPSVDSLEEVTLQSTNFAAEFGQVAGGLVNMTSRSGTNQYHGTAFEYLRNEFMDAGRAYTNDGGGHLVRPRSRNHDFGFTAGGPIWIPKLYNGRNKTFFFFNLEWFKTRTVTAGTFTTVPTAAYRTGNFATALTGRTLTASDGTRVLEGAIYDPATERTVNGQLIRDVFAGNIIPQGRIDPVAAKIQALIPNPTNSGLTNNLAINEETSRKTLIPSLKIDHNFSSATKLSVYLTEFWQDVPKSGADGLPYPISPARIFTDRTPTFRLSLDRVVTPTFLVHLGAGEVRYDHIDSSPSSVLDYDAVKLLGLVGSGTNPAGFPNVAGLSSNQGGMSSTIGPVNANNYYNDKPTAVASATWIRGNHTYKFGGEWRRDIWEDINTRGSQGKYNFNGNATAQPYLNTTSVGGGSIGFPYASFYLGLVDNATTQNKQDPQIRKTGLGFYAQDTWKITRKLTFDYGVRWDYETQWREMYYRTASFSPNTINPSAGGLRGGTAYEGYGAGRCNCTFTDAYPLGFGPRLGLAYQINSKTVLRAGWGIVYGRTGDGNYVTNTQIIGVGYNTISRPAPGFGRPGVVLQNGIVYNQADLYAVSLDPGIRPSPGLVDSPPLYIDRSGGRPSRVNQWNIALQREINKNLTIEAAYVGNRGAWLRADNMIDWNGVTLDRLNSLGLNPSIAADRALLTSTFASNGPALAARGFKIPYAGFPLGQTLAQSLRPFPQFGSFTNRWVSRGDSWYDSLQMKLTKRFSHGFDVTGAFSWQKDQALGLDANNDVYNRPNNKYISASSQPLILAIGFTYETQAVGKNSIVRNVTRGWTVSGLFRYSSGLPIQSPGAQGNLSSYLFRNTFANRVPGQKLFLKDLNCHCIDPNKELVLNPAAWTDPAVGSWGTAAAYYDDYRQQRRPAEQLGVGRIFRIRESMTVEFRGEFFNVFNRTEMNSPTSGNALQTAVYNNQGVPTAGFGYINGTSLASGPRQGQLLARFRF